MLCNCVKYSSYHLLDLKYPQMFCFMALKAIHFLGLLLLRFDLYKYFKKKAN